jgi:hypothetical protein
MPPRRRPPPLNQNFLPPRRVVGGVGGNIPAPVHRGLAFLAENHPPPIPQPQPIIFHQEAEIDDPMEIEEPEEEMVEETKEGEMSG